MTVRQNAVVVALIACGLLAMASLANAASVSVTDANLLQGMSVTATSELIPDYPAAKAVDGQLEVSDWVSTAGAGTQILGVHGFDSPIAKIRIWGNTDIPILSVSVRSSTNDIGSTNSGDYETLLVPTTVYDAAMTGWTLNPRQEELHGDYYMDYAVSAPVGTKSLLFDFSNSGNAWVRVEEVQAFAVPEPTTIGLLVTGLVGMLAYAWRKRK